jgi:hypothetical protein
MVAWSGRAVAAACADLALGVDLDLRNLVSCGGCVDHPHDRLASPNAVDTLKNRTVPVEVDPTTI